MDWRTNGLSPQASMTDGNHDGAPAVQNSERGTPVSRTAHQQTAAAAAAAGAVHASLSGVMPVPGPDEDRGEARAGDEGAGQELPSAEDTRKALLARLDERLRKREETRHESGPALFVCSPIQGRCRCVNSLPYTPQVTSQNRGLLQETLREVDTLRPVLLSLLRGEQERDATPVSFCLQETERQKASHTLQERTLEATPRA